VVSGGVRRSALISFSNLSDDRMRNAKTGQWWIENPQRALANNSAVYTERPEIGVFMREWLSLYESRSGERGIFNREAAKKHIAAAGRRKWKDIDFGGNPCMEILLKSTETCNLTEVVTRPNDTKKILKDKIYKATILGTLQSTFTDFRYLRKAWQKNAEEERLLGVSLTGIMDNKITSTNDSHLEALLDELRLYAIQVNKEWAEKLGISPSAGITCGKPSGTVSNLVNASPGMHARHSKYISRAVRENRTSPISVFLKAAGVPWEPEVSKPNDVDVFYFPLESPEGSVTRDDLAAVQQLEVYLTYKQHWTEHNQSCTISVREHEWLDVGSWVFNHFDSICGVSFLPFSNSVYKQAPYTELTEQQYLDAVAKMPVIDWSKLVEFEKEDHTTAMKEYACSSATGCAL
jgi:ribonucleoside-diphosphate reductase alpha chain